MPQVSVQILDRVVAECEAARNHCDELRNEFEADMKVLPIRLNELIKDEDEMNLCVSVLEFKRKQLAKLKDELQTAESDLSSMIFDRASVFQDLIRIGQEFVENCSPFEKDVAARQTVWKRKLNRNIAELHSLERETASFLDAQKQLNELAENLQKLISEVAGLEALLNSKQTEFNKTEMMIKRLEEVRSNVFMLPKTDPTFVELGEILSNLKENNLELFCDGLYEEKLRLLSLKQDKVGHLRESVAKKSDAQKFGDDDDDEEDQCIIPPLDEVLPITEPPKRTPTREPPTPIVSVQEFAKRRKRADKNRQRDFVPASSLYAPNITSQSSRKRQQKFELTPPGQRKMTAYLNIERI